MRSNSKILIKLATLVLLTLAAAFTSAQAETLTATVAVSPLNESPPITNLTATGGFLITVDVTRDGTGNITSGKVNFIGTVNFPGAVTINGLHIHEGVAGLNGSVRFGTDYSGDRKSVV